MVRFRSRQLAGPARGAGREVGPAELRFANVELNLVRHEVVRAGSAVPVTALEYELLAAFLRQPYVVLSRQQLAEAVWQVEDVETRSNFVDAAVLSLRRRLEFSGQPRLIHTVRGYGYALRAEPSQGDCNLGGAETRQGG
ncbi:MAG: winged helix-turn-helix domain-containing protein [Chloroflexota bacterium]